MAFSGISKAHMSHYIFLQQEKFQRFGGWC